MRKYTNFEVTEGMYGNVVSIFSKIEDALEYVEFHYGVDNIVEQIVQIIATNNDEESETYSCLEVYDMIKNDLMQNGTHP